MKYFFCYNKSVSDYLQKRGIKFITVAQDLKTKKVFSLYLIDEQGELQKALDEYKAR